MLEALPALWRGETVTDEEPGLHDATLGPLGTDEADAGAPNILIWLAGVCRR
jgi:hypothetical protein